MNKTIKYSDEAREELLSGVRKIAKAVKGTLGPSGKNVLIRNRNGEPKPFATKDGVTVAAQISSDNYMEQIAIEAVQDAANNADNKAGDGTTTATILVESIFELGSKVDIPNLNIIDLKRGIDLGVASIVKSLKELSEPCQDDYKKLLEVALISSNNDQVISDVVVDAYKVAGNQGVVNIKRSRTSDTFLTTIKGVNLETGFISQYFINSFDNNAVEFEQPYIYMTNEKITKVSGNFDKLLQTISKDQKELLIICKDIDPQILSMLVENSTKGHIKVAVCKAPGFGETQNDELKDLGIVMGMKPFMEHDGLAFDNIDLEKRIADESVQGYYIEEISILDFLPRSEGVLLTKNRLSIKGPTDISDEKLEDIEKSKEEHTEYLRGLLEKHQNQFEKSQIQTRISKLSNGIAYINIGAISDMEYDEKQHRIQDALYAVKSAAEEGIIPGGGTALLFISTETVVHYNKSIQAGINVVLESIRAPFFQVLKNVGIELKPLQIKIYEENFNQGVNARTAVHSANMIKEGIVDPTKVTRVALENAASIAGMLLTTDCVVIDNNVYENNNAQNGIM